MGAVWAQTDPKIHSVYDDGARKEAQRRCKIILCLCRSYGRGAGDADLLGINLCFVFQIRFEGNLKINRI